jgi:hypothetical protein
MSISEIETFGYYTATSCVVGKPDFTSQPECELSPINSCPRGESAVEDKLLKSGHYLVYPDGTIHSRYFNGLQSNATPPTDPLIVGKAEDIQEGTENSFCMVWEGYECYTGLKNWVRVQSETSPPIYVSDNHNLAFFGWEEARVMGFIEDGALLIHMDRHRDNHDQGVYVHDKNNLEYVARKTEEMSIASFIIPAIYDDTLSENWNFYLSPRNNDKYALSMEGMRLDKNLSNNNPFSDVIDADLSWLIQKGGSPKKLVLDIDIDAFVAKHIYSGDESSLDNCMEAAQFIGSIANKFGVITLATSPGFADQTAAAECARQIVQAVTCP